MRTTMADTKKTTSTPPAFTHDELVIINNALNEVCNGLSFGDDEFQTRIGHTRAKVLQLLAKVGRAVEAK